MLAGLSLHAARLATGSGKEAGEVPRERDRYGLLFVLLAVIMYGTSPIIIRQALYDAGPLGGVVGGLIAYAAATCTVALGLFIPSLRRNVMQVSRESARWFVYSGVFVAAAQGFLYSALALAPIMLVIPLLQLSWSSGSFSRTSSTRIMSCSAR